ncbi:hypothetical protein Tco_0974713 [Tanacetum coccineum]|uniref:Retrotransposon gag domain-containing protein n=1 Tax=Tanacetum coccineum TaxID=301880 RepID=A0ABQ5ECB9_9ASTR
MVEGEIDNLTMDQYLALTQGNQAPGVVKPEIGGNVNFEIRSQFMRELREETFSGNKNDDAHEHVERVLDIVSLFNILGVSHDAVILRVFPITITRAAKRWVDRLSPGTVNYWDLLKKAFIQRYYPPSKTTKQLEEICNFKQEGDESLYQAWERYNDLLYKCPTHDINSHQKVNIFYNGLGSMNHKLLDSQGPIPGMTPSQALTAIQTMADHSQKWHDGSSSRNIDSSGNAEGITAIVNKLDSLGRDMKKLKENMHAIQVGCQTCRGAHLDKECPLNEEVKRFFDNKKQETDESRMAEALAALEATLEIKKVPQEEKKNVNYYVDPYDRPIPFPRRLKYHAEEALVHKTMESLKKIKINRPLLKEIRQMDNYAKHMKDYVANKPRTKEDEEIRMNPMCSTLLQN